jgi:protoporphyrinogen oxidase
MLRDEHWIYVPDPTLPFYRIGFPANVSRNTCPPGSASLSIECGLHPAQVEKRSAREIAESAVRLTEELGIARVDELLFAREVTIDPAYVIDRSDGRDAFRSLFEELAAHGIHPIGRYGRWEYFSMEDAFSSGHDIADAALSASREPLRDTACAP